MKKTAYYRREFLNQRAKMRTAAILASLELYESRDEEPEGCATLHITDCNRAVSIDLSCYDGRNAEWFRNSIYKLNKLESAIRGLREAMEAHAASRGYKSKGAAR